MAASAPTPPNIYRDLYVTYDARPCIPVLEPYGGDSNASQTVLHAGLINSAYDEIAQVVVLLQDGLIRIVHRITMYRPRSVRPLSGTDVFLVSATTLVPEGPLLWWKLPATCSERHKPPTSLL